MAEIGKLTPITGSPWPTRHVQAPEGESRRRRAPKRRPDSGKRRDEDEPPHIDEYA